MIKFRTEQVYTNLMSIIPSPFVLIVLFLHKKKGTQSHSSGSLEFVNSKVFKNKSDETLVHKQKNINVLIS